MSRASGVLLHVSSLWGDYSEGSLGKPAVEWVDYLADLGFTYWQVLPFCLPDEFYSPYKSFSAFSFNPFFIDLDLLCAEGLLTAAEVNSARQKTPYSCEFARLSEERMPLLAKAAERLSDEKALEKFFKAHPYTGKFCEFMALKAANGGKDWHRWTVKKPDEKSLRTWRFTQYKFFEQWMAVKEYANKKGVKIIGDIPIYVALDSSDVWADPKQFQLDEKNMPKCVAGVPPDYFAEDGQLWGNPLYDWKKMEADGFSWWKDRTAFMCELFDGIRIDHFRGLESYYSIAATEKTAKNGKWIKGPGMKFVKAISPICKDKLIIAEDLGDIDDKVRKLVDDSGFPGMRVLQFAFLGDNNSPHLPHNYCANCVAYTGTHDNNTLLGYVWELDEGTRKRLLDYCGYDGSNWDACYNKILEMMFRSHADTVIIPVQDLLLYGSDTRLNTPGTADDNWNYRITKEQLEKVDREKFRKWNKLYGRI